MFANVFTCKIRDDIDTGGFRKSVQYIHENENVPELRQARKKSGWRNEKKKQQ